MSLFSYKGGEDFLDTSVTLMFDPAEAPRVCSALSIWSDDILEDMEYFVINLSSPLRDNSLVIAEPNVTVTIIDTSGEYAA